MQYDFFIAGRWRNHAAIKEVLDVVRSTGKTAYCFIENIHEGEKVEFRPDESIEMSMRATEALTLDDPFMRSVFETDIAAQRNSTALLLVFPAGLAAHMEAGVSYGLGRPCYAVGKPEKTETLYAVFDEIFPDIDALRAWLETAS